MKKIRDSRIVTLLLVATTLSLTVVGCGSAGTSNSNTKNNSSTVGTTPQKGGDLVIGIESEADVLDPQRAGGWVTWRINRQIFEPLVDEDLSQPSSKVSTPPLKPDLATSWEVSKDGLTYTFHIRNNVKFQDGTPLDAKAVEFNVRRMWDKSFKYYDARAAAQTNFVWQALKSVKVVDPMTIQMTMKHPFSPFLRLLAMGGSGSTAIISPTSIEKYGNDGVNSHPIGTGPFKFVQRILGQKIVLARNDSYWGKKPYLDQVIFDVLPDASARVSALESGAADIIAVPPPDSIVNLKSQGFKVETGNVPHVWYLSFNFNDPIMKNLKVRQAIIMSINRAGMAHDLLKDTVNPAYSVQAPGNEAYDPTLHDYPYDPQKAKQLLAEAGYPNGFTTTMMTSTDGSGQILPVPMAEYIQQNLAQVGIHVKLQTYEWIAYLSKWAQGMKPGIGWSQQSWGMTTPFWLYIVTNSSLAAPNGPNVGDYRNAALDSIENEAVVSTDPIKTIALWKQANRMVSKDAVIAPIVNDKAPYVMSSHVHGFIVPAEEWYDLTNVWLSH